MGCDETNPDRDCLELQVMAFFTNVISTRHKGMLFQTRDFAAFLEEDSLLAQHCDIFLPVSTDSSTFPRMLTLTYCSF